MLKISFEINMKFKNKFHSILGESIYYLKSVLQFMIQIKDNVLQQTYILSFSYMM
jgi:hypothetical protein